MQETELLNSDIKALLILLLLKTGTSAYEINTALQMAAASRVLAPQDPYRPEHEAEPRADTSLHTSEANKHRSVTPKQALRNIYLAPLRGYAA
jgi:hypothetical protein